MVVGRGVDAAAVVMLVVAVFVVDIDVVMVEFNFAASTLVSSKNLLLVAVDGASMSPQAGQ